MEFKRKLNRLKENIFSTHTQWVEMIENFRAESIKLLTWALETVHTTVKTRKHWRSSICWAPPFRIFTSQIASISPSTNTNTHTDIRSICIYCRTRLYVLMLITDRSCLWWKFSPLRKIADPKIRLFSLFSISKKEEKKKRNEYYEFKFKIYAFERATKKCASQKNTNQSSFRSYCFAIARLVKHCNEIFIVKWQLHFCALFIISSSFTFDKRLSNEKDVPHYGDNDRGALQFRLKKVIWSKSVTRLKSLAWEEIMSRNSVEMVWNAF